MSTKRKPSWAGRIPGGLAPEAWDFLHSLPHDAFLWSYDVTGTMAHVKGLENAGVLTKAEGRRLGKELAAIRDHPELIEPTDEDVHSAIERVLTERLGAIGAKVHAGRSRNDQVATATRLWVREELHRCLGAVVGMIDALCRRAEETATQLVPGYTHLQRAQPVSLGHWLCAHAWPLARDVDRLELAVQMTDVSPLGAGALATSTLGIDPAVAQKELEFAARFQNSMDAVSDRDFLCDSAYACSMALTHLSRLAEEIVLWSSSEFGFIELPDAYATGSSMMPQKKNPDVAELARGSTGIVVGALTGLLVTLKALPLAYDRDLQVDKQHTREIFDVTVGAFEAMRGVVSGMSFNSESLDAAVSDPSLLATDAAEGLLNAGEPFRAAHEQVAERVRKGLLAKDGDASGSVRSRKGYGGPSAASVKRQLTRLRKLTANWG
jgi:argininosuccinate lyase